MSIPCSCPECGYHYKLADELAGKSVLCPECQSRFTVKGKPQSRKGRDEEDNDEDDDRPRRRENKHDASAQDGRQNPSKGSGIPALALIGGSAFALLLLVGLVVVVAAKKVAPPAQITPQAGRDTGPSIPPDQTEFANLINDYESRYRRAANEIQKTQLRFERATDLKRLAAKGL